MPGRHGIRFVTASGWSALPRARGRRFAAAAALLVLALLGAGGLFYKDHLEVEWHIQRLDSPEEAIRLASLERLLQMRAVRAIRRLGEMAAGDERERAMVKQHSIYDPGRTDELFLTPVLHAIHDLGRDDLPAVERELARMQEASYPVPGRKAGAAAYTDLFHVRVALARPGEWIVERLDPGVYAR